MGHGNHFLPLGLLGFLFFLFFVFLFLFLFVAPYKRNLFCLQKNAILLVVSPSTGESISRMLQKYAPTANKFT